MLDGAGLECQVVRACLDRDRQARRPRLVDHRQRVGCRQVHDVRAHAVLAAEINHQRDGVVLGCRRPRRQVRRRNPGDRRPRLERLGGLDRPRQLRVHQQRRV